MASERLGDSGTSADGKQKSSGSSDPDVLAAEIEATREDLAETLDAIADKVSPKRVAARGQERAKEAVAQAKEVVAEKAATAREVVTEKAALAKEKAVTAKDQVAEKAATARDARHASDASSVRVDAAGLATGPTLPPTTGVQVPPLAPRPAYGEPARATGFQAQVAVVPKPVLGGAVAALLALLLLRRRRRRA